MWPVPTSGGGPAGEMRQKGLAADRLQRDKASENSHLTAGPISSPKYWQKECSEPACHMHGPKLDTLEGGAVARRRKNSQHISRYRGEKITHETPAMKRFFALSSGRSGERYEAEKQQSTTTSFQ